MNYRVSYFKGTFDSIELKSMDIFTVLEEIKNEKHKGLIANIRLLTDKTERNELKKSSLPMITFSGTFSTRNKSQLKKSSGLAMMDYDDIDKLDDLIELVNKDKFTFASFVSPSGNGLKVLVKIPPVANDEVYKEYYLELQRHFDKYAKTDDSTKDISRGTYLSIDKNLFINADSKMFTDKYNPPERVEKVVTNIPLTDQDEIADRLEKWFKKNYSTIENRNTNLYKFARALNSYGVNKNTAEHYILRYSQVDFKEDEILLLINSAYKNTSDFGTNSFEDEKKVQSIKMKVIAGVSVSSIEGVTDDALKLEIDKHKSDLKKDEFWYYTEKEVIKMATFRFLNYLENNNISKYYPSAESGYLYIKKDDNFIKEFDENRIKDFTLSDLRQRGIIDAFEMCAGSLMTFNKNFLSMLSTSDIDIQRDTKEESFIYYNNTAVRTTKDSIDLLPYSDIKGLVWEDQVIDRNLNLAEESDGEFKTFIWKIAGENEERYYTFKSVIGYLLHSYQNEGKPKVIIFNDEMISDVPNGGSGKGLIHKAISHIKRLSTINGKGFDPSTQFAYQTVNTDTQVLLFDDIDRNFKFENLFSLITEGLTIEKKGKDAIKIPFNESPKISITTNYTVKGEGSSHLRRVFEVEMASYFNDKNTPEDEFGHLMFSDWSAEEWSKFDNYMIRCIQYFLKNGLVESKQVNLKERKLRNETSNEFIEFMDSFDWSGSKRWIKTELKDLYIAENEELKYAKWFTTTKFNKWVTLYTDTRPEIGMTEGKTNGVKWKCIEKIGF
jgi:hypothetical protein